MSPARPNDYVVVTNSHGRPPVWTWEIQRRSSPLGVRLYGGGFKTEFAAKLAGEKALGEFLQGLAQQQSKSNPVHSQAPSADDDDTPSCGQCSGPVQLVRTIPRMGVHPGLFVFRCTRCNRVETRQQPGPAGQS